MLATLKIEGKEFPIEIMDPELQKILIGKKTGYEREVGTPYYYVTNGGGVAKASDSGMEPDTFLYDTGNYYTSEELAKNVARADKLMRQLKRFSVEHRNSPIDFTKGEPKYRITCNFSDVGYEFFYSFDTYTRVAGAVYFDTKEHAREAVNSFRDELLWYFTEYKDTAEI